MSSPNIVITGFMASGKTTVSPLVAQSLAREWVDTDEVLVAQIGMSIADCFAQFGESAFRKLEAEICTDLAARTDLVISTGGGALLNLETLTSMSSTGMVVCLDVDEATLEARLADAERVAVRPLAVDWRTRYHQRAPLYARIPYHINTVDKTPDQIAQEIVALWHSVFG